MTGAQQTDMHNKLTSGVTRALHPRKLTEKEIRHFCVAFFLGVGDRGVS